MIKAALNSILPSWQSCVCALLSAVVLIAAFPDTNAAPLAFVALVPLVIALLRKEGFRKSFVTGWIFGTVFFFGTGWWLTFAPITYAAFPVPLAYFLLFCVCLVAGIFAAVASGFISAAIRRFGDRGLLAVPFIWVAAEFLRFWMTGNNWNTIGYSQAFDVFVELGAAGGVAIVSFLIVFVNIGAAYALTNVRWLRSGEEVRMPKWKLLISLAGLMPLVIVILLGITNDHSKSQNGESYDLESELKSATAVVVAVQPNVPMAGIRGARWIELRTRQIELAENELSRLRAKPEFRDSLSVTVILPESPMNFHYEEDEVFRTYINAFAVRNNVSVLFNSAEPDTRRENGYFNSAVLVSNKGEKAVQYDKIHLLPFGEFVPLPEFAQELIPPMVGRFSFGEEYDLLPFGEARAGVMICFESHFPSLSREFANRGADVLIEMTNDGYLGPTPVLRQHMASAAFRAAETGLPVLRVTNVGITAYIDERGRVFDGAESYVEATRVWAVKKSSGRKTFFVRYGEWFSWICVFAAIGLPVYIFFTGKKESAAEAA